MRVCSQPETLNRIDTNDMEKAAVTNEVYFMPNF